MEKLIEQRELTDLEICYQTRSGRQVPVIIQRFGEAR